MFNNYSAEFFRYIINGLLATALHYATLKFNLEILHLPSAAIANMGAAIVGITFSFIGSRYFVFRKTQISIMKQAIKFSVLYGFMAALHGFVLLIWTDWLKFDYRFGFIIATAFQILITYVGNKTLVFKK